MDFNPTYFSHPKAADGFTLAHRDEGIRRFWIEHGIACRKIGAEIGRQLGTPCVTNVWIPDGYKDVPVDRKGPREIAPAVARRDLRRADRPGAATSTPSSASCSASARRATSSARTSSTWATPWRNKKLLCLDAGHFHPTETIADKISSVLLFLDEILLHVSRGVRWDSDHVVMATDELRAIAEELVRGDFLDRVHIGLDFFDASINRIAAWMIGTRAMIRQLLIALLEPIERLRARWRSTATSPSRLAMLEELKTMPFGAVWDYYCLEHDVPVGIAVDGRGEAVREQVLSAVTSFPQCGAARSASRIVRCTMSGTQSSESASRTMRMRRVNSSASRCPRRPAGFQELSSGCTRASTAPAPS